MGEEVVGPRPGAPHALPLPDPEEQARGHIPPGPEAEWAFATANRLLDAMEEATSGQGEPSRAGVLEALSVEAEQDLEVFVYMIRAGEVFGSYTPEGMESD